MPPEFQTRSSQALGAQPNETATQADGVSVDEDAGEAVLCQPHNDEEIELPEQMIDMHQQRERNQISLNIDEKISYVAPAHIYICAVRELAAFRGHRRGVQDVVI